MYEIEIITTFSAAHRLREYKGKCERLHGHNYRVHVTVRADKPGPGGMVIDFGDLKAATNQVLETLDHSYLNDIAPFDVIEPSAENLAAHIFEAVTVRLGDSAGRPYSVTVWESDSSRATFIGD
ncbi:MAG: 6-carboxytetrahydropterin synthase QueD [Thermodesulfobacteriota bacterium]